MVSGNPINEDAIEQELVSLLRKVESSQATGYQLLAQQQDRRLARLRAVEARLAAQLEPNDPRILVARQATRRVSELGQIAQQRVKRLAFWPELRQDDFVVTGQVRQADGLPAVGVTIHICDQDRKFDEFFGATQSNGFGDFAIVRDVCHFRDKYGEKLPDLYITVVDQKGQTLVTSTTPILIQAGHVEHFNIQLPSRPDEDYQSSG